MVGELDVAIAGHRATIVFLSEQILFRFVDYKTARAIVNRPLPSLRPLGKLLSFSEIELKAQVGNRKPIELFPQPNWIVRWLSPTIRQLVDTRQA